MMSELELMSDHELLMRISKQVDSIARDIEELKAILAAFPP